MARPPWSSIAARPIRLPAPTGSCWPGRASGSRPPPSTTASPPSPSDDARPCRRTCSAASGLGLPVGPWLDAAKAAARRGEPDDTPIAVPDRPPLRLGTLRSHALRIGPGQAVAHMTDRAFRGANRDRILALARGADQLFIEAAVLERDASVAAATRHLAAAQAGGLARAAGVRHLALFHLSARSLDTPDALRAGAPAAFAGGGA